MNGGNRERGRSADDAGDGGEKCLPGYSHHPLAGPATRIHGKGGNRFNGDVVPDDGDVAAIEFQDVRTTAAASAEVELGRGWAETIEFHSGISIY